MSTHAALTTVNFQPQFTAFLSGMAATPVFPVSVGADTPYDLTYSLTPGAAQQPLAPLVYLPHHNMVQGADAPVYTISTQARVGEDTEDDPEVRFKEGMNLVTFKHQLHALRRSVHDNWDTMARVGVNYSTLVDVTNHFKNTGDFLDQAVGFFLAGATYALFANTAAATTDSGMTIQHQAILLGATESFAKSAEVFAGMRYHHAAAIAYEASLEFRGVLNDPTLGFPSLQSSAARMWHQSVREDRDLETYRLRLNRGLYHAANSTDTRVRHGLLDRSQSVETLLTHWEMAGQDWMRMAYSRLDARTRAGKRLTDQDWGYVRNMIGKGLQVWGQHAVHDGSLVHGTSEGFLSAAELFASKAAEARK